MTSAWSGPQNSSGVNSPASRPPSTSCILENASSNASSNPLPLASSSLIMVWKRGSSAICFTSAGVKPLVPEPALATASAAAGVIRLSVEPNSEPSSLSILLKDLLTPHASPVELGAPCHGSPIFLCPL